MYFKKKQQVGYSNHDALVKTLKRSLLATPQKQIPKNSDFHKLCTWRFL